MRKLVEQISAVTDQVRALADSVFDADELDSDLFEALTTLEDALDALLASEAQRQAFGEALRRRRVAVGLGRAELAKLAGVDQVYVSAVERGVRLVSDLNRLALIVATMNS